MGFLKVIGAAFVAVFKKITGKAVVPVEIADVAVSAETIDRVIEIVNNIKNAVSNPIAIVLTDLIPGTIDNTIRDLIEKATVPIIAGLTFSKSVLEVANGDAALTTILGKVHFASDPDKDAFYHALAARLLVAASDGKVTWSEAVSIIEIYFKQVYTPAKAA